MTNRRGFLFGAFIAAVAPSTVAQMLGERLNASEEIVVQDFASRGVRKLLLMNKKVGRLRAIEDGKILFSVPAISSARRGDTWVEDYGATPAGIFPLVVSKDQKHLEANICFAEYDPAMGLDICKPDSKRLGYFIHKTVNQRRTSALARVGKGKADEALRLSGGCINLAVPDYDRISVFAQAAQQSLYTPEGVLVFKDQSFLVTMPEKGTVEETRKFFGIPAPL